MKAKLINDRYRNTRGGYSRLLNISCEKCESHVCMYQKDGPGNLRRLYLDRIIDPGVSLTRKDLSCPNDHLLGVRIIYKKEELVGKLVLGVVNFPPRKIGPFESEVLTLGVPDSEGMVILITPDKDNPVIGGKLF